MALSRRDFLGRLLASAGAAYVSRNLLWVPDPAATEIVVPTAILSMQEITETALTLLAGRVDAGILVPDDGVIPNLIGAKGLTNQYNVTFKVPVEVDRYGLDATRYLMPAMAAMAERVRREKFTRFGELPLPNGVDQAARASIDGLSLRGVMQYDMGHVMGEEGFYVRFDVLGGPR